MSPPCHFLLYSSNTMVTLTEETNRSSHSDTKRLDHFIICNITVFVIVLQNTRTRQKERGILCWRLLV